MKNSWLVAFILVLLLAVGEIRAEGGKDGGGGGAIVDANGTRMVDLFLLDRNYQDFGSLELNGTTYSVDSENSVRETSAMALARSLFKPWVFDPLALVADNQHGLRSGAIDGQALIQAIVGSQFVHEAMMGLTTRNLNWSFTDKAIEGPNSAYYLPSFLESQRNNLALVAYYNFRRGADPSVKFTVSINRKHWDQMGILSRTSTIIHENLRHYQMPSLMTRGKVYFGERALQQATAIIVGCKANQKLSQAMAITLLGESVLSDSQFDDLLKAHCERLW